MCAQAFTDVSYLQELLAGRVDTHDAGNLNSVANASTSHMRSNAATSAAAAAVDTVKIDLLSKLRTGMPDQRSRATQLQNQPRMFWLDQANLPAAIPAETGMCLL